MYKSTNNYEGLLTIITKLVTVTATIAMILDKVKFAPPPLSSGSGKVAAGGGSRLTKLCEKVTSGLADCLSYDLILYQESCSDKVWKELGAELPQTPPIINLACFSDEDLLKLSALSILPSYSLRSLGIPFHTTFPRSIFHSL